MERCRKDGAMVENCWIIEQLLMNFTEKILEYGFERTKNDSQSGLG